jgi:hypothetical protein
MKSLMSKTLVPAFAMALWATSSIAATGEMSSVPVSPTEPEQATQPAAVATVPAQLHALNRLDTQSLAAQTMTDQELKAVEGGSIYSFMSNALTWYIDLELGQGTVRPLN